MTRKVECPCYNCKRTQIPLRLGWGTTIHSCQGQTVGVGQANRYIVINPGTNKFEAQNPGALFVALSRAKSSGGQNSDPDFAWHPSILVNEDRICFVPNTPRLKARFKEITRINNLAESTKRKNTDIASERALSNFIRELLVGTMHNIFQILPNASCLRTFQDFPTNLSVT